MSLVQNFDIGEEDTALLTLAIQTLRRNYSVAMTHVHGGLDIVSQYQDCVLDFSQNTLIPFRPLIIAFARLERRICEIHPRIPTLNLALTQMQYLSGSYENATPLPSPLPRFGTVEEA